MSRPYIPEQHLAAILGGHHQERRKMGTRTKSRWTRPESYVERRIAESRHSAVRPGERIRATLQITLAIWAGIGLWVLAFAWGAGAL